MIDEEFAKRVMADCYVDLIGNELCIDGWVHLTDDEAATFQALGAVDDTP